MSDFVFILAIVLLIFLFRGDPDVIDDLQFKIHNWSRECTTKTEGE